MTSQIIIFKIYKDLKAIKSIKLSWENESSEYMTVTHNTFRAHNHTNQNHMTKQQ